MFFWCSIQERKLRADGFDGGFSALEIKNSYLCEKKKKEKKKSVPDDTLTKIIQCLYSLKMV